MTYFQGAPLIRIRYLDVVGNCSISPDFRLALRIPVSSTSSVHQSLARIDNGFPDKFEKQVKSTLDLTIAAVAESQFFGHFSFHPIKSVVVLDETYVQAGLQIDRCFEAVDIEIHRPELDKCGIGFEGCSLEIQHDIGIVVGPDRQHPIVCHIGRPHTAESRTKAGYGRPGLMERKKQYGYKMDPKMIAWSRGCR